MTIEIDGVEYPLRYSLRALKKFEQKTKKSVFQGGDTGTMPADAMSWLIYVGIVDGCNLADIEPYVDLSHVTLAVTALQQYTGEGKKKK